MNRFITAVTHLDVNAVKALVKQPKWREWAETTGKNAMHYLCGIRVTEEPGKADASLDILKLLLKNGVGINSVHRIEEKNCDYFPATPLWYAYTKGRNEKLYKYLLKQGADPRHCWWAIAWYDDVVAAKLWLKHGSTIDKDPTLNDLFVGSFGWKKLTFAKWLLDQGADVNTTGPDGLTALMIAVRRKDENAIRWLTKRGADPDFKSKQGFSARSLVEQKGPKRLLDYF